jgi:hypothetical protein
MHAPHPVTVYLSIFLLLDGRIIFFERLRYNLNFDPFLKVHLQTPVFFLEIPHARHHGKI